MPVLCHRRCPSVLVPAPVVDTVNQRTPMATVRSRDLSRPYLVIPKLIAQPTWGGQYIVASKGWSETALASIKIGQSYELFSGSNLSLLTSSDHPKFTGELTDRDAVQNQTTPDQSIALADLIQLFPAQTLGEEVIRSRGNKLDLLIKYTQALGNSYQVHLKAGVKHPKWRPKPESWYFFEPGLITLGIKSSTDWDEYKKALTDIALEMTALGKNRALGKISAEEAAAQAKEIVQRHKPEQYVNLLPVARDELIDLSSGGLHHSWEENPTTLPLGNVLYEVQTEAMDDVSTFRGFDKGKIGSDGSVRDLHLNEYFEFIDRSPSTNNPTTHIRKPVVITQTDTYLLEMLLGAAFYTLTKLTFTKAGVTYTENPARFRHLFVKNGKIEVTAGDTAIIVSVGHSCFIPAAAGKYSIRNLGDSTEVLISF